MLVFLIIGGLVVLGLLAVGVILFFINPWPVVALIGILMGGFVAYGFFKFMGKGTKSKRK